jgi:acetylornithine deacetylase
MIVDPAFETDADAAIAQCAGRVLERMGLNGAPAGVPFGSDASKLARAGIPSIIFGPGSIDQAHAAVEYVDCGQVVRAAQFYSEVVMDFN